MNAANRFALIARGNKNFSERKYSLTDSFEMD